jgi:hypothetical protein
MPHWRERFSNTTHTVTEIAVTVFDDNESPAMAPRCGHGRNLARHWRTVDEDRARLKRGRAETQEL